MIIIKCTGDKNFGDGIVRNGFIEELCNNNNIKYIYLRKNYQEINYITIGSVLRNCDQNSIICGTGFIHPNADLGCLDWKFNNVVHRYPKEILFVRGKLTRQKFIDMGMECPENYGDMGILCPLVYKPKSKKTKFMVGILPHYVDKNKLDNLKNLLEENNIQYNLLDIMSGKNPNELVNKINECEFLISSTLHGLILGIVYNIKTIWVQFSKNVVGNKYKFNDFFSSLNISYSPCNITMDMFNNYIKIKKEDLLKIGINILNLLPFFTSNILKQQRIKEWKNLIDTY